MQKDGDGFEREFGSTLRRGQKVAEKLSRVPKQTNEQPVEALLEGVALSCETRCRHGVCRKPKSAGDPMLF